MTTVFFIGFLTNDRGQEVGRSYETRDFVRRGEAYAWAMDQLQDQPGDVRIVENGEFVTGMSRTRGENVKVRK